MGMAPNLVMATLGRILVGVGVSTVFVCNFKLLAEWFNPKQFVIMGGIFMAMGGVGALFSSAPLGWVSNLIGLEVSRRQRTMEEDRRAEESREADYSRILGQVGLGGQGILQVPQMSLGVVDQLGGFGPGNNQPLTIESMRGL